MTLLVTGAAGFIGSNFIREALTEGMKVIILDKLTYAGHLQNIEDILKSSTEACLFVKGDIGDFELVRSLLLKYQISAVINFAAESHVDNSIQSPQIFLETNVLGTFNLLQATREYLKTLPENFRKVFRFVHVSTDEVFGALGEQGQFSESTPYAPNSPYSASKASSDHLVRAWHHTYGLPTIITNCSNNYGPRQFPEKLIPRMIQCALKEEILPVYGAGQNIRDWIHVKDHCRGVLLALTKGKVGSSYCFGGNSERTNIDVVNSICTLLDEMVPRPQGKNYSQLIKFVEDRLGHDFRYAIDDSLAQKELGFSRLYKNFDEGLKVTIQWYLENQKWVKEVMEKSK